MIDPVNRNYYYNYSGQGSQAATGPAQVPSNQPINTAGTAAPGGNASPGVAEAPKNQQIGPKECKT